MDRPVVATSWAERATSRPPAEAKDDRPVVVGLRPLAPITHWRGGERLLGANIAQIAGVRVQSMAELRTVLTELRQLGRQGMVAINAELTRPLGVRGRGCAGELLHAGAQKEIAHHSTTSCTSRSALKRSNRRPRSGRLRGGANDVRRACELAEQSAAQRWLIEGLWAESAVGIVGGDHGQP